MTQYTFRSHCKLKTRLIICLTQNKQIGEKFKPSLMGRAQKWWKSSLRHYVGQCRTNLRANTKPVANQCGMKVSNKLAENLLYFLCSTPWPQKLHVFIITYSNVSATEERGKRVSLSEVCMATWLVHFLLRIFTWSRWALAITIQTIVPNSKFNPFAIFSFFLL